MVDYTCARALDLFDGLSLGEIDLPAVNRWKGG